MFPAVAKIAANQVFEIGELVLLILEHLDELSLVRVQGVCQRFRDLVKFVSSHVSSIPTADHVLV